MNQQHGFLGRDCLAYLGAVRIGVDATLGQRVMPVWPRE